MMREAAPPRLAELLLRLTLPPGIAGESVKGDLDQEFDEYVARTSVRRARAWYLLESVKFVTPSP